jgi:hypothetical protein
MPTSPPMVEMKETSEALIFKSTLTRLIACQELI